MRKIVHKPQPSIRSDDHAGLEAFARQLDLASSAATVSSESSLGFQMRILREKRANPGSYEIVDFSQPESLDPADPFDVERGHQDRLRHFDGNFFNGLLDDYLQYVEEFLTPRNKEDLSTDQIAAHRARFVVEVVPLMSSFMYIPPGYGTFAKAFPDIQGKYVAARFVALLPSADGGIVTLALALEREIKREAQITRRVEHHATSERARMSLTTPPAVEDRLSRIEEHLSRIEEHLSRIEEHLGIDKSVPVQGVYVQDEVRVRRPVAGPTADTSYEPLISPTRPR